MQPHSFLWHYLWIAPHALQLIIAIIMLRRGLWREFPAFFAYTLFEIVEQGTLFVLDHKAAVTGVEYWRDHWLFMAVEVPLRFATIFEIFSSVFRDYPGLKRLTTSCVSDGDRGFAVRRNYRDRPCPRRRELHPFCPMSTCWIWP